MAAAVFRKGDNVELVGLVGRPELNGRLGVVAERSAGGGDARVAVRLMAPTGGAVQLPGALLSMKPANLCRPPPSAAAPPASGDSVECALRDALVDSLGPDVVEQVKRRTSCARCCEPCEGKCRVPHPPHLQVDCGSCFGRDGAFFDFSCQACGEHYTLHSDRRDDLSVKEVQNGPRWCYEGEHTLTELAERDLRRVRKDLLSARSGPDLQQQLDELPETHPDLKVLVVKSDGGYDDSVLFTLRAALPQLEEVQLIDVAFGAVHLTTELTPKVKKLQMQNIPDGCELDVRLPELEHLTVHYFGGDGDAVQGMLDAATKLCTFESYKLWSNNAIAFASNALTDIKLHRSDSLSAIELWAPRLQSLNVQACYWLEEITILESHPLAAELPAGFTPTRFQLYTVNASLTPELKIAMRAHPRVTFAQDGSDDENFTNPMEAFWAQMAARGGPFGGNGAFEGPGDPNPYDHDEGQDGNALMAEMLAQMAGQGGPFGGGIPVQPGGDVFAGPFDPFLDGDDDEDPDGNPVMAALMAQMAAMHGFDPEDMYADGSEDEDGEDDDDSSGWVTTDGEGGSEDESDDSGGDVMTRAPTGSTVTVTEIADADEVTAE